MQQTAQVPLVMVHGWMDVGASFQFMVDAFKADRLIIAPDWRGYGQTTGPATDNYWFPDYMADLDAMLDTISPNAPVDLLGHSMGGNVAMTYAGVRPDRVRRLVNLEGFGMPATQSAQAPTRYAKWLDELKAFKRGDMALKPYPDAAGVARRLMKNNPRLTQERADWLAGHWAAPDAQGVWHILGDAAHKLVNAQLYKADDMAECFKRITAPTLVVTASHTNVDVWWQGRYTLSEFAERLKVVPNCRQALIQDAAHMLHHDQPEALAALVEGFLAG